MRTLRVLTPVVVLVTSLALFPASATARTTTTYRVAGAEVYANSTEGVFAGIASRAAGGSGTWYADVLHDRLGSRADIRSGGSFRMLLTSKPHTITGRFSDGEIREIRRGADCTKQVYSVTGDLKPLSAGGQAATGDFAVLLTHHRKRVFGRCLIYSATVSGSVTFALASN